MHVKVSKGSRNRWRWFIVDKHGKTRVFSPRSYEHKEEAEAESEAIWGRHLARAKRWKRAFFELLIAISAGIVILIQSGCLRGCGIQPIVF